MDGKRTQAQDEGEQAFSCEQALSALPAYAQGTLAPAGASSLREHVAQCSGCAEDYRRSIEQRAQQGRGLRGRRAEPAARAAAAPGPGPQTEPRPARADVRPTPAKSAGAAGRRRRLRLRTVLLPAFFTWLFLQVAGVDDRPARIEVSAARGEVTVAERPYGAYERPPSLGRGIWCHTLEGGSATLSAPGGRVVLEPWSSVQAEQAEPLRLRLRAGGIQAEGRVTVVSWIGVIDLEGGAGSVVLVAGGLELACSSGALSYEGPLGSRRLAAGERQRLVR